LIERERTTRGVRVSSISVWELFMLVKKGRLELRLSPASFLRRAERLAYIEYVPVDNAIAQASVELPDIHGDPADRLILATARELGCGVLSKDPRFAEYGVASVLW
jgi:PIN domain nuclease of toxin-antitoxin system